MDSYMLPSLPPWVDTSMLDATSLTVAANGEEGVVYPHCPQGSAAPLCFQNTASFPMTPFAGQRIPTKYDWESHRTEITRLYRDEKRTLNEVMKFMLERYDFRATTKMYKTRISDWGLRRNLRWSEREYACRIVRQRWLSGEKVSKIIVRGQEKNLAIFLRHMRNAKRGDNNRKLLTQVEICGTHTRIANQGTFRSSLQNEAPMAPLYPAGDERHVEVICMQTAYVWQASSNRPITYCDDMFGNLRHALWRALEGRYYEARVMLNRAGEYFQWQVRRDPDVVLLYILRSLPLRYFGRLQHFDPLDLFHKHAHAISDIIHGPCHPLTVILSQLLAVENRMVAASSAVQVAVHAIESNPAFSKVDRLTHYSLEIFAEILEASGDYDGAGQLLQKVLNDYQVQVQEHRNPLYEIRATYSVALHYLDHEPQKHEEAVRLFESILHITIDPTATETQAFATFRAFYGLAAWAVRIGDLGKAEHYFRGCAEAAVRCWGEGDSESVQALENLARILDLQGRHDEAERMWNQCQFSDDEDALSLTQLDGEVELRHYDTFEDAMR